MPFTNLCALSVALEIMCALLQDNLSFGCATKPVSILPTPLQRLARILKFCLLQANTYFPGSKLQSVDQTAQSGCSVPLLLACIKIRLFYMRQGTYVSQLRKILVHLLNLQAQLSSGTRCIDVCLNHHPLRYFSANNECSDKNVGTSKAHLSLHW